MRLQLGWLRSVLILIVAAFGMALISPPAYALDAYITRILQVKEPIALNLDGQGKTRLFSPEELSEGKALFAQHCLNCHAGGATLPNPVAALSLTALKAAIPPHDTIDRLVTYMRHPITYDGSEESYLCRRVPEDWLAQSEVENLAGFLLLAAEKAPGWGRDRF
jgi:photosystem II cytochrome c550